MGVCAALLAYSFGTSYALADETVLKVIPSSNITILDPIWTTSYVTRGHGYMIYDTLFGTDIDGKIQPQMVDTWSASDDSKTWTFTLRDGLAFHDGAPVTSADVIASLKRWSARDTFGGVLASFVDSYEATDDKTFVINMKEPFGLVLEALGKPSSNVPFIMPERVAETPPDEQIKETIGSGPYIFQADAFSPGEKVVYLKNENYVPRSEEPSGTAGGKIAYIDRVEWTIIRDPQTQANALINGEVDIIEQPAFDNIPALQADPNIEMVITTPAGMSDFLRFNFTQPPFNDVRIRKAALHALGQEEVLHVQIGVPGMYRMCLDMYPCGTPYATGKVGDFTGKPDPEKAKAILDEAGYNGEKVVILRATDDPTIAKMPLVAQQLLRRAGFNVEVDSMDLATMQARRAQKEGWNAFTTAFGGSDILNPLTMAMMNARGEQGWIGWLDDPELEEIKARFARSVTDEDKLRYAEEAQLRAFEIVTHVPFGQHDVPAAVRKGVTGIVPGGARVYWNIQKQ